MKRILGRSAILCMVVVLLFSLHAVAEEINLPLAQSTGYFDAEQGEYVVIGSYYALLCDDEATHFLLILLQKLRPLAIYALGLLSVRMSFISFRSARRRRFH